MHSLFLFALLSVSALATSPAERFHQLETEIDTSARLFARAVRPSSLNPPLPYYERTSIVDLLSMIPGSESMLDRIAGQPEQVLAAMSLETALAIVQRHKIRLAEEGLVAINKEHALERSLSYTEDEEMRARYSRDLAVVRERRAEIAAVLERMDEVRKGVSEALASGNFEGVLTI